VGLALGSFAAWGLSSLLTSVVYEVTAAEPTIWTAVGIVLAVTTILASWVPARHAARVDPVELLREQ
jgi:ABC-type antimicrobial peptide transport system permease subunit